MKAAIKTASLKEVAVPVEKLEEEITLLLEKAGKAKEEMAAERSM